MTMLKPRLNKWQYDDLNKQFSITPALTDGTPATKEHYALFNMLNSFGFHPHPREAAMELAEELLHEGWRKE